jgi:hypothetical protein
MVGQTPQPARAATISVPADYATIQEAIAAASDGDTITVAAGSYAGGIRINKSVTLSGAVGSGPGAATNAPVIDGSIGGNSGMIIAASGVTVEGFIIQNFQGGASTGSGIQVSASGNKATIRYNTIQNTNWAGILAWTNGDSLINGLTIENNSITMGAWSTNTNVYGIECTNCSNAQIASNQIAGGYVGIAITAQGSAGQTVAADSITISGNTVTGSSFASLQLVGFDPTGSGGTPALTSLMIENNTLSVADGNTTVIFGYPLGSGSISDVTIQGNTLSDGTTQTTQTSDGLDSSDTPIPGAVAQTLSKSPLMLAATQTDANMIDLRNVASVTVSNNTVVSTGRSGALVFVTNSSSVTASGNSFTSTNAAGQVFSCNTCQGLTMQNNTLEVNSPVGNTISWKNHAIDLYFVSGTVLLDGNIITIADGRVLQSTFYHGINIQGSVEGTLDILNSVLQGNDVGAESTGIRIRVPLAATQVIKIKNNVIGGFFCGIRTDELPDEMTIQINQNNLAGNTNGICARTTGETVDGTYNWWGSPTGPNHPDNPRGDGAGVNGKVDYTPWLGIGEDTDPSTPGFQPEITPMKIAAVIYLPMIAQFPTDEPPLSTGSDLSVQGIRLEPNKKQFAAGEEVTIYVDITNQGFQQANPFWVDLYINPLSVPNTSGVLWHTTCSIDPCFGIAWKVETLEPGNTVTVTNTITLQSTVDSYSAEYTKWPGWFANGTTDLYVYVDSWGRNGDGNVVELNEQNNLGELRGLQVTGTNPDLPSDFVTLQQFLPRPGHPRQDAHGE